MKQIQQSLRTGVTEVADISCPQPAAGQILIRSRATLVSAGTERMLVDFGNAGWIDKARQQPDKVRMVLDKIGTDGLVPTVEAVLRKLEQPLTMGYCNAGVVVVVAVGRGGRPCFDSPLFSAPAHRACDQAGRSGAGLHRRWQLRSRGVDSGVCADFGAPENRCVGDGRVRHGGRPEVRHRVQ